jgi:murein DD-endopeptidase MepM/ murein hydrolase activator NlpD
MESRRVKLFVLKSTLLIVLPTLIYIALSSGHKSFYDAYENGVQIGCVTDKEVAVEAFNQAKSEVNSRFGIEVDKDERLSFKNTNSTDSAVNTINNLKDNIIKNFNMNVSAFRLIIGDKDFGYIAKKEEGKQILEKIADKYIDMSNIDRSKVVSIGVESHNQYIEEKTSVSNVLSTDEIADKIIDADKDSKNPLVKVEIKTKNKKLIDVEPSTIIDSSEDLFMGESKTDKGSNGKAEIEEEETFINGKKINTEKLSEKVTVKPKDTVITRGIKNPISSGVAFLSRPSRGVISSNFGARWGEVHHGIDIAANVGDPIGVAMDGKIKETSYSSVYGNMIVVDHGEGIETVYGHCSKVLVKAGDKVKRGDVIGRVGNTGRSTGPHVHFELRVNGTAINPNKYIK